MNQALQPTSVAQSSSHPAHSQTKAEKWPRSSVLLQRFRGVAAIPHAFVEIGVGPGVIGESPGHPAASEASFLLQDPGQSLLWSL